MAATGYMLGAVLFYSLIPILIKQGSSGESPFLFYTVLRASAFITSFLFLYYFYRPFINSGIVRAAVRRNIVTIGLLLTAICHFEHLFFAWAILFIDVSIVSVIYDAWPIVFVIYFSYLEKLNESRKAHSSSKNKNVAKTSLSTYGLMVLGLMGVVFAISSENGGISLIDIDNPSDFITGIVISIAAMFLAVLAGHGILWGKQLGDEYDSEIKILKNKWLGTQSKYLHLNAKHFAIFKRDRREIAIHRMYSTNLGKTRLMPSTLFALMAYSITSLFVTIINVIIGTPFAMANNNFPTDFNQLSDLYFLIFAVICGGVVHVAAGILWRMSNTITKDLAVNAISYLTPIAAILWLYIGNYIDVKRIDFLIIGLAIVIITNLLISFKHRFA